MLDAPTVAALVSAFPHQSDGEALKSRDLILTMLECTQSPFSRNQFAPGHITATGLVMAPDGERLLLVHHVRLERWLLPGGHVEPEDEAIWDTARREVMEETGARLANDAAPLLVSLDVHGIPPKRGEPYHLHHDLVFQFRALTDEFRLSEESRDIAWCGRAEFARYLLPGNVRRAFERAVT